MNWWLSRVRIVLDTNVIISALLSPSGNPSRVVQLARHPYHKVITSAYQLHELDDVIRRAHLRNRISADQVFALISNIHEFGEIIGVLPDLSLSPDPKDNPILATAIAGRAELVISGDKNHVLALRQVNGIPIVSVSEALIRLGAISN